MSVQLKVPSIVCEGCAETITKTLKNLDPESKVAVDLSAKTVIIESNTREDLIKQAITDIGHKVE